MASRQAGKKRDVDADARPRPQDRSGGAPAPRRQRDDSPPRQPRKRKRAGKQRSGFGKLIYWGAVLALWAVIAAIGLLVWIGAHLPPIQSLEIPKRPPSVLILGANGATLATRGDMGGAEVPLRELPDYAPKAFVAIEDRRFYSHHGIDPWGILRAGMRDVLHRGATQGGSTITQQLAKNLFLTQERTVTRKLQEAVLALWLEHKFSKAQILELYLNRVYFGSGAYGIEAAAQRYFGKSARKLTLPEAAMLAGLVQSPSRLAPSRNPDGAERRAGMVIAAMADLKMIGDDAAKRALITSGARDKTVRRRLGQLRRRLGDGRGRRPDRPCRGGHRGRDLDRSGAADRGGAIARRCLWRRRATSSTSAKARWWR